MFYLVQLLTNDKDQDGSSVAVYPTEDRALVAYHQTLASFHNAADVKYAVVQILEENGNSKIKEIVDHRPEPEPTPEPEPEETPEE